jgi:hypothetical protein
MVEAYGVDIATDMGVAALARAQGTTADVARIREELTTITRGIAAYQAEVTRHLRRIERGLSNFNRATDKAKREFEALTREVQGNTRAMQTIAEINFSGWSTTQRLQAVRSGLFPGLTQNQQAAQIRQLEAEKARDEIVADVQRVARDFGSLASIANDIGVRREIVTGLQQVHNVATSIVLFAAKDYLGGIAALTSLAGLGAQDAGSRRHAAMMQYLDHRFAEIDQMLRTIIGLHATTVHLIVALATDLNKFRDEVLEHLGEIERTALRSERVLQAIALNQWTDCDALINRPPLTGQYSNGIQTRDILLAVISRGDTPEKTRGCYTTLTDFLDARVRSATWSGQLIDAENFPSQVLPQDTALQRGWAAFQRQRINAYIAARQFILEALPNAAETPALFLARFSQPVVSAYFADELKAALGRPQVVQRLRSFRCNERNTLTDGLRELICFGLVEGAGRAPRGDRWQELLGAALIGPHSNGLVDTGLTLATIVDFADRTDARGAFIFVDRSAIEKLPENGVTARLSRALGQRKGQLLLEKLRWLTEASVLQQSIAYGDYTAELIEKTLYDPSTRSFNIAPGQMTPVKRSALAAMRMNPVLARNTVLLGMRHAIADALGGPQNADAVLYQRTYYSLALEDFAGIQGCSSDALPRQKLVELLPNWQFQYRTTGMGLIALCPPVLEADLNRPGLGAGVAVALGDFYVLAPTPLELSSGVFKQPDTLRKALEYRDRLSQAIIDRRLSSIVKRVGGGGTGWNSASKDIALSLLNEAWRADRLH